MSITPADIIKMTDRHQKGRALEVLGGLLLASDRFDATRIIAPTPDKGIDRFGLLTDNTYVALQAKAYDGKTVSKKDWESFIGEVHRVNAETDKTISQVVMFSTATDGASPNAQSAIKSLREEGILVSEWYRDELLSIQNAHLWNKKIEREAPSAPRDYQLEAIEAGKQMGERGKIIMATATGKTLVASELIKFYDGLCLILVPNMELVRQVCLSLDRDLPDTKLLAVFSGEEVHGFSVTTPATTNADAIKKFAQKDGLRVIVSTYHSSAKVAEGLRGLTVSLAVMDEAHRTVGGPSKTVKGFQVCMQDSGIKIKHRLFMTATPKMYSTKAKDDVAAESYVLYSMDDEVQYGPELYKLTPGKAIEMGRLAPFDVLAGLFRHTRAKQYLNSKKFATDFADDNMTVEDIHLAAFLLLAAKEQNLTRTLVFTGSVDRAGLVAKALRKVAAHLGVSAYAHDVSYKSTTEQRREALGDLAVGKRGYEHVFVVQVDLFTEGVDIPALDGVIFVDSKQSVIAIAQAIGRALRLDPKNDGKRAKIIIPVIKTEKQDIDKVIDRSTFKSIRDYTDAIRGSEFSPEQVMPKAIEIGAATLGAAWPGEDGAELLEYTDSEIQANQKCIETIVLGARLRWTLERLEEECLKPLGHTLMSTPATPLLTRSRIELLCKNGHTFTITIEKLVLYAQRGTAGCQQCSKPRWTLERLEELLKVMGHTLISAPTPLFKKSPIIVKCNKKGHTFTVTPANLHRSALRGGYGCLDCTSPRYTHERVIREMLSVGLTVLNMPDVVSSKEFLPVICEKGHTTTKNVASTLEYEIGCVTCRGYMIPRTAERIQEVMSKVGYIVVGEPFRVGVKLQNIMVPVRCVLHGHESLKSFSNAAAGTGCDACSRRAGSHRKHKDPPRTHCNQGHSLSGDNLYVWTSKSGVVVRHCKECRKHRSRGVKSTTTEVAQP